MIIQDAIEKMIDFYGGYLHDIDHFLEVWSYARTIGMQENLDVHTQEVLELSAVVHDIACPLCRIKYGNASGKHQEEESAALVEEFFEDFDELDSADLARISWIVSHHHTYTNVDGLDYQILLEADYLVNAGESDYKLEAIKSAKENIFKTETGLRLLESIYLR